jgi:hypothetical protein
MKGSFIDPVNVIRAIRVLPFPLILWSAMLLADSELRIIVKNEMGSPLIDAQVTLKAGNEILQENKTDEQGVVGFAHLAPGNYLVAVSKDAFQPMPDKPLAVQGDLRYELEIVMVPRIELKQSMDVNIPPDAPVERGASPPDQLSQKEIRALPNKPKAISEALPLLPSVVRTPDDQIHILGSAEHSSAFTVNTADVTDPATGQFGMSVPVDIVESLNVLKTPYVAQYGRFSAGLVSVETRRGGDKWNFELNDPVPEFRIRGGTIQGVRGFTPRLNFSGPLIASRLYLSEGLEYRLNKRQVRTLGFPENEIKEEAKNIFTQLDAVISKDHLLMGTVHWAPWRSQYVNLDYFNPRPVTPNFKAGDYTITVLDRILTGGRQLESLFALKHYQASVWGQGTEEMFLTPTINQGNYFSQQARSASRIEWGESVSLQPLQGRGVHQLRFGFSLTHTADKGEFQARPVNITDLEGVLLKRIEFVGGQPFNHSDLEVNVYGQDQWKVHPRAAFDLGVRLERQRITHALRMGPRVGLAWMPLNNQATVFRVGFGLFFNHVPLSVYTFNGYPEQMVTTYGPGRGIIAGPERFLNVTESMKSQNFPVHRSGDNMGNFSPYSATWSVELEHPLTRFLRIRSNYLQSNTNGLVILSPGTLQGQPALILGGGGRSRYRQFEVTSRVTWREQQEFLVSYVHSWSQGDINDFNRYLGNFPFPLVRPNYFTQTPGDAPHRFLSWGVVNLPLKLTIAPLVEIRTGFPYALLNEGQEYVGIPNSTRTRFPTFFSLDARLTREFKIFFRPKYRVRCSVRGTNLTNHFNPLGVHANTADPQFGVFFGYVRRFYAVDMDVIH